MRKGKNLLILIICFSILFLISCDKLPIEDPSEQPPSEGQPTVTYIYRTEPELVPYEQVYESRWWNRRGAYYENIGYEKLYCKVGEVPWTSDMPSYIKPNSTVIEIKKQPYSCIHASLGVSRFLSEKSVIKKDFLLVSVLTGWEEYDSIEERNERLKQWNVENLIEGEIVGKTGHLLWRGNAKGLDEINKILNLNGEINVALVCFADEFVDLYGVTFEQANILIEKGHLDMWCLPTVESSPLYDMHPLEIAAYLAEHPESLE